MLRVTLAMLRSSSLPGDVGLCPGDISAVADIVNRAQMNLLYDPLAPDEGWWGGWARYRFNVTPTGPGFGYITTPQNVARLIVMDVCSKPARIRNGFYEFLEFSPGLQPKTRCCPTLQSGLCDTQTQGFERDNVVTLSDQTIFPSRIRFYPTDPSDVGKTILLQGTDQNHQPVTSMDGQTRAAISGEMVTLRLPFADSMFLYQSVTGIQKAATLGPVTMFQVDAFTGNQKPLTAMDPNETSASYRRYLINGLPLQCCTNPSAPTQVTAQARLDFVPVQSDPDYTIIQNIPAIIEECQAIKYSKMDAKTAPALEAKHHQRALSLLFGQLDHYLGTTNTAIRVPLFGSHRLRPQPI